MLVFIIKTVVIALSLMLITATIICAMSGNDDEDIGGKEK